MCAFLCAKSDTSHSPPPQFIPWRDFIAAGCQRATECHMIVEPDGNLAGLFGSPWWRLPRDCPSYPPPPPPAIVRPCSIKIGPDAFVLSSPCHDGLQGIKLRVSSCTPTQEEPRHLPQPRHDTENRLWYDEAHADNKKHGFCRLLSVAIW